MRSLAIDVTEGLVYEGEGNRGRGAVPTPSLMLATIFLGRNGEEAIPEGEDLGLASLIFREDSFDAVTRLRRGRFYERGNQGQPEQWYVHLHPGDTLDIAHPRLTTLGPKRLHGFYAWPARLRLSISATASVIALGVRSGYTLWRVIEIERLATGEDLVTLRARSSLGLLPELREDAVPADALPKVKETIEALVRSAHTSAPSSIVDRARDAAQWCIGVWWAEKTTDVKWRLKDLADLSKSVETDYLVVASIGRTIARLHARAKPNENARRQTRPVMEADAEYSLAAVGLLLRDIGWAV